MKRSTRWMVLSIYYLSHILGLIGFAYKTDSGKMATNFFITFYSRIVGGLMFSILPMFAFVQWKPRNTNGPELHFKLSTMMFLVHILAVLITVVLNWIKRNKFMLTIRDFQNVKVNFSKKFQMSKRVEHYYEKAIRTKFYVGIVSNIITFAFCYDILRGLFNINSPYFVMVLGIMVTMLNIVMDHNFFALLNVNVLLAVVNEEVERILTTASILFKLQRLKKIKAGALIVACCKLADELDDLSIEHRNLQILGERINHLYQFHGACILLSVYVTNINVVYMSYMVIQHKDLSEEYDSTMIMFILPIALYFFYKDLNIFIFNMYKFGDFIKKTASLLNDCQTWLPTLDERLEKSLKDFSMQLALFPFEMKLLGLFQFDRSMSFATFGSTISNAIVLMQFDYKHSKNVK